MKYQAEKTVNNKLVIAKIRLDDECKNGHQDFAITGDVYEAGNPRIDRYLISSGCCHDEIVEAFPEFQMFVDLHLSDFNGSPMHPEANGWYYCKRQEYDKLKNMMRCNDEQLNILKSATDQRHFHYLLQTSGIVEEWKKEAEKGIAELERLTGGKFVNTSTRSQFTPLSESDMAQIQKQVTGGYYSESNTESRFVASVSEKNDKIIKEDEAKAERKIMFIHWEISLKKWVAKNNLPLNSFRYDSDKKEILFNWIESIGTQIYASRIEDVLMVPENYEFIVKNELSVAININGVKLVYNVDNKRCE